MKIFVIFICWFAENSISIRAELTSPAESTSPGVRVEIALNGQWVVISGGYFVIYSKQKEEIK